MKKILNTLFHPKKTKLFWLYIVAGILGLIIAVMLMPVWDSCPDWVFWKNWGRSIVNMIICACIVLYLALFLVKKVKQHTYNVVKILTIIEFVLLALIALGCILQQFRIINIPGGACAILGVALWCRGIVEVFRAYFQQRHNKISYPLWSLAVALALITFGVYIFCRPFFSDLVLLWIFIAIIIIVSVILIADGIMAKPDSSKNKTEKKETEEKESKEEKKNKKDSKKK